LNQSGESPSISQDEWEQELIEICPEVGMPGYWDNLEVNCEQWAGEISVCPFWNEANQQFNQWRVDYQDETKVPLLTQPELPPFVGKGQARIMSKLYQRRFKDENYKSEVFPESRVPVPRLNDLVRTRIACQYIDGVEFLASRLFELMNEMELNPTRSREGRLEGYFAQHLTFEEHVLYRFGGSPRQVIITCEVQVATDMSTRIWEATHKIYEATRETDEEAEEWQWNPQDPRFISRQLGHMIHLADGLLVQLRESIKKGET
jgi:hypothetical protein